MKKTFIKIFHSTEMTNYIFKPRYSGLVYSLECVERCEWCLYLKF